MNPKTVKALTISIIAMIAASVLYLVSSLSVEFALGKDRIENDFNKIVQTVQEKGPVLNYYDFITEETGLSVLRIYRDSDSLFIYPFENTDDLQETGSIKVYSSDVNWENSTIHIQTAYLLMRPSRIHSILQLSFIFILLATILSGIILILIQIEEKKKKTPETDEDEAEEINDSNKSTDYSEQSLEITKIIETENLEIPSAETSENTELPETEQIIEENTESLDETEDFSNDEEISESQDFDTIIDNAQPEDDDMVVFEDFVLPVNEESELAEKLEKELIEAGANEMDLSLFLIRFPGVNINSQLGVQISEAIKEKYLCENQIFKYGTDGFAVIKPGLSVDEAEDFADINYTAIKDSAQGFVQQPFVGISSRTTRMLSGVRLIKEAQEALNHAAEDPDSPIIGFHVDIEKYRDFLKNSNQN